MKVICPHWSSFPGLNHGGKCALGLGGGCPSVGICRQCEHYQGEHDSDQRAAVAKDEPKRDRSKRRGRGKRNWHNDVAPLMWQELHERPFVTDGPLDAQVEQAWLDDDFTPRVSDGGCSCRSHWKKLLEDMPPDYSSRDRYWIWTVKAHNRVNAKMEKPEWIPPY